MTTTASHPDDDAGFLPVSLSSGMSTQKLHLILGHLYLLPWFARRCFDCELPLKPFLDANPALKLGGLPIASKLSRYGAEPPYLPTFTIDRETEQSTIEEFVAKHPFPLVTKPLFGARSRNVQRVSTFDEISAAVRDEPMVLQPYVDAPKEYGINVMRVGPRLKIYGLTEVPVRTVWGDGERSLRELTEDAYGAEIASQVKRGSWLPPDGQRVSIQVAACPGEGDSCLDITDKVTPELRATCEDAADQIGLRFGRFDVKAHSLEALQEGDFRVLEVNGSPSLDLTLYDNRYPLSVKIERLRAHWDEFFHQARSSRSREENSWALLATLLWFSVSPKRCVASFRHEVHDGELTPRSQSEGGAPGS
jgi:hypothetical protein